MLCPASVLLLPLLLSSLVWATPQQYGDHITIKTLPPNPEVGEEGHRHPPDLRAADALLSDWEGDHWASLDGDQDKVALSWTTDEEFITFQVRMKHFFSLEGRFCANFDTGVISCF